MVTEPVEAPSNSLYISLPLSSSNIKPSASVCSSAGEAGSLSHPQGINPKNSKINNLLKVKSIDKATLKLEEERAYAVLDEIRVSPNVWYLRKVRNKKKV